MRETTKSSTSEPSRASAWARIPAGPATKSSARSSGTRRRAARDEGALRDRRGVSSVSAGAPVAARSAARSPARRASRAGRRPRSRAEAVGVAGADDQRRWGRAAPRRRGRGSGGRRGTAARGRAPGRCSRARGRRARAAAAGRRRGRGRSAGSARRPGGDREPVRPGAGADDDRPRAGRARGVADGAPSPSSIASTAQPVVHRAARRARGRRRRRPATRGEVDDPGRGRVQGRDPGGVRLDLAQLVGRRGGAGPGPRSRARGARARRAASSSSVAGGDDQLAGPRGAGIPRSSQ